MSDDMKEATKKQNREYDAKQRATMSDDMKEARKKQKREYSTKRRATMSDDTKEATKTEEGVFYQTTCCIEIERRSITCQLL